jgi:hypothetical protein
MRQPGVVAFVLLLSGGTLAAQDPARVIVERAAAYVADYREKLAMVVAEERYQQEVRYPAPPMSRSRDITTRAVLVSDFLLVRNGDDRWVPFRDVFEHNGDTVRDRQERLSALFLDDRTTAFDRARRITDESARYNIGNLSRNINVPTLALEFLTDAHRGRFSFESDGAAGTEVRVIRYQERQGPFYIATTGNRGLPASGRFWIHVPTGRVERTELKTSDRDLDAVITVTYRDDEAAGLWVPGRMDEAYVQKADRSEIRGTAVYSRYRRFQITTSDKLAR